MGKYFGKAITIFATFFVVIGLLINHTVQQYAQLRLFSKEDTYDNVQQLYNDLYAYARVHNGFNDSAEISFEDWLDQQVAFYNLEDVINPETDIIPNLHPAPGNYFERLSDVVVSIEFTEQPIDASKPLKSTGDATRDLGKVEGNLRMTGHVKEEDMPMEMELKGEQYWAEWGDYVD